MKTPTMTMAEIERALEAQNRELETAFEQLELRNGGRPVAVSLDALQRIQELCERRIPAPRAGRTVGGIRC